jgi:hypothetical protein
LFVALFVVRRLSSDVVAANRDSARVHVSVSGVWVWINDQVGSVLRHRVTHTSPTTAVDFHQSEKLLRAPNNKQEAKKKQEGP